VGSPAGWPHGAVVASPRLGDLCPGCLDSGGDRHEHLVRPDPGGMAVPRGPARPHPGGHHLRARDGHSRARSEADPPRPGFCCWLLGSFLSRCPAWAASWGLPRSRLSARSRLSRESSIWSPLTWRDGRRHLLAWAPDPRNCRRQPAPSPRQEDWPRTGSARRADPQLGLTAAPKRDLAACEVL